MAAVARAFGLQPSDVEQCGRIAAGWSKSEIDVHLDAGGNWAELLEVDRLGDATLPDGRHAAKTVLEEARVKRWGPQELRARVSELKNELCRGGPAAAGRPGGHPSGRPGA